MKPALFFAAVSAALVALLHYAPVHVVSCDRHACQLSDGSFRLAPTESRRFHPETGAYK